MRKSLKQAKRAEELARYYSAHYPAFAHDCLKIALEQGGVGPFMFNSTQWDLHRQLEQQLSNFGRVRAIILKPRREGLSTYIGGRFYHKTIFGDGLRTRVTAHLDASTKALFKMVQLYQRYMPDDLRPATKEDSANSLSFPINLGSYALSTARSAEAGRGDLAHLYHGSEVAYWRNAEDVVSASTETVGDEPGTEIVFESTGAPGTYFEELWERAVEGGDFLPIFYPWYKSERNERSAEGLILLPEEKELIRLYPGMTVENISFRRHKLLLSSEQKFRREYPATPADAFTADGNLAFISPEIVQEAVARVAPTPDTAPRILGVDPSQTMDGDPCGMCLRQGSEVHKLALFNRDTVQERADVVRRYALDNEVDFIFIDQGGSGKEIYDFLVQWGMSRGMIYLVPFGAKASNRELYPNKRVEMYTLARAWLSDEGSIPNDQQFRNELSLTKQIINNNGQEVLESKRDMRKSPNLADAFALTFAFPVTKRNKNNGAGNYR